MHRRDLLRAVPLLAAGATALEARALTRLQTAGDARLPRLLTGFSAAERDRRWQRVRTRMREAGLDCLLTPAASGEGDADSLYLTGHRGWVVFPLDGPVVLVRDGDDEGPTPWVSDVRTAENGKWSPAIIEALRTVKATTARIGMGRLHGVLRNDEGDVPAGTLDRVRTALPNVRFASAYELLMRVKLVRSDEEIAALTQATAAGERAIRAMIERARPGVEHKDVWLAMFAAMTASTGETPQRLAIRAGNEANTSTGGPMLETIRAGQVMNQEIGARVLGYMAQVNHSICIGKEEPADWRAARKYCIDLFHELVSWIRPGRTFMDLCRVYVDRVKARDASLSPTWVLVHTCGFGDGPRMGLTRTETPDLVIEPGMVFTIKPRVPMKGARPSAQFGDPVLVTESGAQRLGTRELSLVATG